MDTKIGYKYQDNKENSGYSSGSFGMKENRLTQTHALTQGRIAKEEVTTAVKRKALAERNIDTNQPVKKPCLQESAEDQEKRKNLEFIEGLKEHPSVPNLYSDLHADCEYFVTKIEYNQYKERILLDKVYKSFGVSMPQLRLLTMPKGSHVLVCQYIRGKTPTEYLKNATKDQRDYFYSEVCKSFAADVLFRDVDILSGYLDKAYVVDEKGVIWRTSVSMLNAADDEVAYPVELWEARDANTNAKGSMIWITLDILKIAQQIIKLINANDIGFYGFSERQKAAADKRLTNILVVANKTVSMNQDGWSVHYIDSINKHMIYLKKAGCERGLPTWLRPDRGSNMPHVLYGPKGEYFEGLRGRNSVVSTILMPYVYKNGGNYKFLINWMVGHESSGWSSMSQILMHFLTLHRKTPNIGHYWKEGDLVAKYDYEDRAKMEGSGDVARGQRTIENSFIILHAFTQLVLGHIDFPNNSIRKNCEGVVRFLRTESKHVMRDQNILNYANNREMKVAPYSSGSVVASPPLVHGTEVTERIIPHHRVIALYFMLRTLAHANHGAFSNDLQNEFTAILGGINCNYIGTLGKN